MKFSEEQMKELLALKENLTTQMDKQQEAIEMLAKNLQLLDLILKESSFTKASQLATTAKEPESQEIKEKQQQSQQTNSIPITQGNDGKIIANAYVTAEQVSIVLDDGVEINADTPPFKSFFLDRIVGEMKKKDSVEAKNGKIQEESIIDYIINKNGSDLREIIIKNYRQKERVNEIINTAGWSLTRMLENVRK
ncbi:MAG: hypothetical protein ACRBB2_04080 [Nitrosopumilus sp.]